MRNRPTQCGREDCFAWTPPNRYKNCCIALEEVELGADGKCPFYKSKGQALDERRASRARARVDEAYRQRLAYYGIKFRFRGEDEDGD